MTWASPKGGAAPCDEGSIAASKEDKSCMDFIEGEATKALVDNTVALSTLTDLTSFDAVFFAGGFGTMWDFPDDPDVQRIAAAMWESGKVVSAVCHGPCALVNVTLSDGTKLVAGKEVAAFTNEEEDAVKCREVVPFTCEGSHSTPPPVASSSSCATADTSIFLSSFSPTRAHTSCPPLNARLNRKAPIASWESDITSAVAR